MTQDKYLAEIQERIKRLPERLRNYITRLEKDVAYYRKMLTETEAGQTSVMWKDYSNEKYLPDKGLVEYRLSNGGKIEVSLKDDTITVRSSERGTLVILPAFGNSFYVTVLTPTGASEER